MVGIATEPPSKTGKDGSSEDLIVAEPGPWSPKFLKELEESKNAFDIMQEGKFKESSMQGSEFPPVQTPSQFLPNISGMNRKQRRAIEAKSNKNKRKKR